MANDMERGSDQSGETHHDETVAPVAEPLIVERFFKIDANGRRCEYARTRNGREIPYLMDDEAEEFFKKYTYEE